MVFRAITKVLKPISQFNSVQRHVQISRGKMPSEISIKGDYHVKILHKAQHSQPQPGSLSLAMKCFSALSCVNEDRLNGGYMPTYAMDKKLFMPVVGNWQWYAESKQGSSGAGTIKRSGGGLGRLDAANEDGFFYKLNKSRLEKLKKMLQEKEAEKDKETPSPKT